MRIFFFSLFCTLLLWGCSNKRTSNTVVEGCVTEDYHKAKFDSFLTQFAQFDGTQLNESFFKAREQYSTEINSPEINKYYFPFLLPYDDECNCEAKELCYRPCYRIEQKNYYLVSMDVCCDVTKSEWYPYDDNTLVTYDKTGRMIDFATIGTSSDVEAYKISSLSGEYEILYTQYCFRDVESGYNGLCDVSEYRVSIDESGNVSKHLLSEEKGVTVAL